MVTISPLNPATTLSSNDGFAQQIDDRAFHVKIAFAQEKAKRLTNILSQSTQQVVGLSLVHLFLLGRDTATAKIFANKFNENFAKTKVVSKFYKLFTFLLLLGVHAFFIYFSLLQGLRRGLEWQYQFIIACVYQFIMEKFISATLECL